MAAIPHSAIRNPQWVRCGLSLVELIVVILILAILAAFAVPHVGAGVDDRLATAATAVVGDLEMARSLAVSNASNYRFMFDTAQSTYTLKHVGTNTALDVLPASPFHHVSDSGRLLTAELDDLPSLGGDVQLVSVQINLSPPAEVADLEFGRLGSTTRVDETVLWLAAGRGSDRRYLSVVVNPTTGLAEPKPPAQKAKPDGVLDPLAEIIEDTL
ncbi:MAG TPA: prepilin-type N-terminal cleavage/methylation domain-containing protein [Pirellulaceae bacterium]|nr:prepilin-type N-terminal cleavage/methylation domain-containing protein [Pirellulaceae bacterium]